MGFACFSDVSAHIFEMGFLCTAAAYLSICQALSWLMDTSKVSAFSVVLCCFH